ncbi:MAG: hypothetical protein IMZ60_03820 [Actinobacteria bacterium]|nr:hypothetical protein [Actinomycetota bacterium]
MEDQELIDAPVWTYESTFRTYNPGDKDVLIRIMNAGESLLIQIPAAEKPTFVRFKDGAQYKVPCSFAKFLSEQGKAFYMIKPNCDLSPDITGLSTTIWLNEFLHKNDTS